MVLDNDFIRYTEEAIGSRNALVAFSALDTPASVSIRLNPFKTDDKDAGHWGVGVVPPWNPLGLILGERPSFTLDPLFHSGAYYVQDSSSMFVGYMLRKLLEDNFMECGGRVRTLDLCASPGGKTTDFAASLRQIFADNFLLVSNEVMRSRVHILADNVARWGDPNIAVVSNDPSDFKPLDGYFDIILTDVPCSGEGMFRKDIKALEQWSAENVALCQARQRRIVADVWPSLREGGLLIYSTCTFNKKENDDNVSWIAETLGAEIIRCCDSSSASGVIVTENGYSLVPGFVPGEGQYCAALRKISSSGGCAKKAPGIYSSSRGKASKEVEQYEEYFTIPVSLQTMSNMTVAVPKHLETDLSLLRNFLNIIQSGCTVGTFKAGKMVPHEDLALSVFVNQDAFVRKEVDLRTALSFLHKDAIRLDDCKEGYVMICYSGHPLGFVKNLGTRCNNLHPQERRIRMDI